MKPVRDQTREKRMLPNDWTEFLVRERMAELHREAERERLVREAGRDERSRRARHLSRSWLAAAGRIARATVGRLGRLRRQRAEPARSGVGPQQQAVRRRTRPPGRGTQGVSAITHGRGKGSHMNATTEESVRVTSADVATFDRVTRRFGEVTAVDGLTLVIKRGEPVALPGPNGAGKTTATDTSSASSPRMPARFACSVRLEHLNSKRPAREGATP